MDSIGLYMPIHISNHLLIGFVNFLLLLVYVAKSHTLDIHLGMTETSCYRARWYIERICYAGE